uniref:Protein FAM136A n=1 Tax=Fibrocapsa japonica TaxID=94617 RepID=A0A7S2V684_9STRA|mmetsp:Transcript_9266/g.14220  ORF Transcript_9266/g.14220 Transcript_9266/m.14220 type:complete len:141 (+) Transcript_9266:20-442(+)|eukprot:CAMPEP_0113943780 /NCGR_PEP_ID=MMETSP1339-20121228/27617_1 /TAXON_ID=94617 /ORGANISM="Fibrocapsa japonica" /LENGTH=140 /DNA_ID=CAMNT_0000948733 /DNA_START=12 /DNA_END=434 /DNA_ORIENTATION=+ /assembly_acc=CAM_ASM_000762
MAAADQAKFQDGVEKVINAVDQKYLRPIQRKTYLCMAKCFEGNSSRQETENCTTRCPAELQQAQHVLQSELQTLQNRVQRCAAQCQEDIQNLVTPSTQGDSRQMAKLQENLNKCVSGCMNDSCKQLKPVQNRIEQKLKQI